VEGRVRIGRAFSIPHRRQQGATSGLSRLSRKICRWS